MAWWNRNQGLESNRPSGIDAPLAYQDPIRSAKRLSNFQNWQDLIVDDARGANLIESDIDRVQGIHDQLGTYDDTGVYTKQPGESLFAENWRFSDLLNPFRKGDENIFGYQKRPDTGDGIMGIIKDQFEYRGAEGPAWDPTTGEWLTAEEQDRQNALGGGYSKAARHARKQRARAINMIKRRDAKQAYSEKNLEELIRLGYGPEEVITDTGTVTTSPGGGGGSEATFTQTSPGGISQEVSRAARGGQGPRGAGAMSGWRLAEGGRIGYQGGEFVEEDVDIEGPGYDENILEIMKGEGVPLGEQVQGEGDILSMLVAKYIEAGFPPDQAQTMAMQELQQMVAESGQGEGLASLV